MKYKNKIIFLTTLVYFQLRSIFGIDGKKDKENRYKLCVKNDKMISKFKEQLDESGEEAKISLEEYESNREEIAKNLDQYIKITVSSETNNLKEKYINTLINIKSQLILLKYLKKGDIKEKNEESDKIFEINQLIIKEWEKIFDFI